MKDKPAFYRIEKSMTLRGARSAIRVLFMMSAADDLVEAWQRTDDQDGQPVAGHFGGEMERREIAF